MSDDQLIHGDCMECLAATSEPFKMVIADPPYNIRKVFAGNRKSDNMPLNEYLAWMRAWVCAYRERLAPGGLLYIYGYPEILCRIASDYGPTEQRWLQWHYYNKVTPNYTFWQRSHESILCLWRDGDKLPAIEVDAVRLQYHPSNVRQVEIQQSTARARFGAASYEKVRNPIGKYPLDTLLEPIVCGGRAQAEQWLWCEQCGHGMPHREYEAKHADHADRVWAHPTVKPMPLTRRLVLSLFGGGHTDGLCAIPFAGSGSELQVLTEMGIRWVATEREQPYIRLIEDRLKWVRQQTPPQLV